MLANGSLDVCSIFSFFLKKKVIQLLLNGSEKAIICVWIYLPFSLYQGESFLTNSLLHYLKLRIHVGLNRGFGVFVSHHVSLLIKLAESWYFTETFAAYAQSTNDHILTWYIWGHGYKKKIVVIKRDIVFIRKSYRKHSRLLHVW